jgi:hypothetical protein
LAFIGFIGQPNDTAYGKDRLSFYARTRTCAVLNGAYEMNAKPKDNWPMAYAVEDAPAVAGVSRTRIFAAIRNGEMIARKAGRQTIIEADELQRWIRSLPTRCRGPENQEAVA